jgi:hypothetical protein
MDFLHFNPVYSVLICKRCSFALVPTGIESHLSAAHASDVPLALRRTALETLKGRGDLSPPAVVAKLHVQPQAAAIQHLALYHDGISCRLCPSEQPYVCRTRYGMQRHLRAKHSWQTPQRSGRPSAAARQAKTVHAKLHLYEGFVTRGYAVSASLAVTDRRPFL